MWEEVRAAARIIAFRSHMVELEVAAVAVVITMAATFAVAVMALETATLSYLAETYTGRQRQ